MKKLLVVGAIILLVGLSIPSTGINVEKSSILSFDGNTLYVGGSGPDNYTKIQDAIDNASGLDTIFVYNGTYYETNITIEKPIILMGENKNTTIIDGSNIHPGRVIRIFTNGSYLVGFKIINAYNGVYLSSSTSSNTITNNIFIGHSDGIYLIRSDWNTINQNIFLNNEIGISLSTDSDDNIVSNNYISNSLLDGIWTSKSYRNQIINNTLVDNGRDGIRLQNGIEYTIELNYILHNSCSGISSLHSSRKNQFVENTIRRNRRGLMFIGSDNNSITMNNIEYNSRSLYLFDSWDNKFSCNNFIMNIINARAIVCSNIWKNNYWNRPRVGPKPIIVWRLFWIIKPYYQPGLPLIYFTLNFDWHPVKEPYPIGV